MRQTNENAAPPPAGLPTWLTRRVAALVAGPLLGLVGWGLAATLAPDLPPAAARVVGLTCWIAAWWVAEPIPIPATSLMPIVLFPLFQIESARKVATVYANHLIILLLAGFLIARSLEIWGLHRRLALTVVSWVGESPRQLVFGFTVAAAFLSMWISNTATTLMLIPIALSVVARVGASLTAAQSASFQCCILLGVAYGANVGGTGTLIGTPPNLMFAEYQPQIDFLRWLAFGVPVVVIFVPLIAWLLTRVLVPLPGGRSASERAVVVHELRALGPLRGPELRVAVIFAITAALWIFKGNSTVPGWCWGLSDRFWDALGAPGSIGVPIAQLESYFPDAFVGVLMALVLFVTPAGEAARRPLLVWSDAEAMPWGMLLLFGGGFAIAGAFESSGLSRWLGGVMSGWLDLPYPLLLVSITTVVVFLTEFTSNTASTAILMPILDGAASAANIASIRLMLPAVIAVSFAFMLPVATAPNAIVFATGKVPIGRMVAAGFWLNWVGVGVVFVVILYIAPWFGIL
ncbi:MAG: SLC13 family permease [Planctomycetota bacterium]